MLSEVRKLLEFTQKDLAKLVGVTQNYYAVIESNPTKSAPLMKKLSKELKIREQFLAFGDRSHYPFLGKFYTFYLDYKTFFLDYNFLITNICNESSFIDIVFFLETSERFPLLTRINCFAMRDEHDTIFLMTCKRYWALSKRFLSIHPEKASRGSGIKYDVPGTDLLRKKLYENEKLFIYEKTVTAPDKLDHKLAEGSVSLEDVAGFFPERNHFKLLYEAHKNIDR